MTSRRGRPIKVLMAKVGLDGHDRGAKVVAHALMESGMEVLYLGLRQSAERVAAAAREEDPDVIGFSILSGAHLPICEKFTTLRKQFGIEDILWLVGGNIPASDHARLHELGVDAVFPTGSSFGDIVETIRRRTGVDQT